MKFELTATTVWALGYEEAYEEIKAMVPDPFKYRVTEEVETVTRAPATLKRNPHLPPTYDLRTTHIELHSMEEYLEFLAVVGLCVVTDTSIEIYDGYRE